MSRTTPTDEDADANAAELLARAAEDRADQVARERARGAR